ncbi:MAG: hypothetical protein FJ044_00155 [Candidatus Cloacimonetes bacterium]|nr:hypothetical protein [Candidatus Cloacimonadota bacterium]
MENKIFSKFNIYDQIGYLLVGSIALLVVIFNLFLLGKQSFIPDFTTQNFLAWFIIAYFLGHIMQAIANIFIKENKTDFSDSEKEILEKAKRHFETDKQSLSEIYLLCYMFSFAKDITGQVQSFNAYYSLYRGWFIVFGLNSLFALSQFFSNWFSLLHTSVFVFSVLLAWLFYKRSKRFYSYLRGKILQTFMIISKNKF